MNGPGALGGNGLSGASGASIECHCISNGRRTVSLFFFIAPWRTDAPRGIFLYHALFIIYYLFGVKFAGMLLFLSRRGVLSARLAAYDV